MSIRVIFQIHSLTRAVNLKRVQNFRFIYRIQWKVREFTWFIYLPEWLTQLPALYQSNLPSPAPCAELTRLSSTKRRSNVVLPVPGFPQTSVVGVMMQKTRSHCCGWGVHKSRKYSYCVAFVSIACIFFILSHYIAFHQICLFYNFQFRYCILAQASQPSQCISFGDVWAFGHHSTTLHCSCFPSLKKFESASEVEGIDIDHHLKWSSCFLLANSLGIRTLFGIGAKSWSSCRHALGTAKKKNIVGCLAPMQEKAAQETWISVAS